MSLVTLFGGLKSLFKVIRFIQRKTTRKRFWRFGNIAQITLFFGCITRLESNSQKVFRSLEITTLFQLTTGLFLAGCLLITAIQLVTDPITCDVKVSTAYHMRKISHVYIYTYATFNFTGSGGRHLQRVLLDPRHLHAAPPCLWPAPWCGAWARAWQWPGTGPARLVPVGGHGALWTVIHLLHRTLSLEKLRGEESGETGVRWANLYLLAISI